MTESSDVGQGIITLHSTLKSIVGEIKRCDKVPVRHSQAEHPAASRRSRDWLPLLASPEPPSS